jgi:hypothetical protein
MLTKNTMTTIGLWFTEDEVGSKFEIPRTLMTKFDKDI